MERIQPKVNRLFQRFPSSIWRTVTIHYNTFSMLNNHSLSYLRTSSSHSFEFQRSSGRLTQFPLTYLRHHSKKKKKPRTQSNKFSLRRDLNIKEATFCPSWQFSARTTISNTPPLFLSTSLPLSLSLCLSLYPIFIPATGPYSLLRFPLFPSLIARVQLALARVPGPSTRFQAKQKKGQFFFFYTNINSAFLA